MVQLIGNCANTDSYECTEKGVSDIFNTIEREIKIVKMKFNLLDERLTKFKLSR